MTKNKILVAGATGNLGLRICRELRNRGAEVKAIVRHSTDPDKIEAVEKIGVQIATVDMENTDAISKECEGVSCVVSAVAGLGDVIVDLQKRILDAAVKAGVERFVPSDFCTDYNDLNPGENRNFDFRRTFKEYADQAPIRLRRLRGSMYSLTDMAKRNSPRNSSTMATIGKAIHHQMPAMMAWCWLAQ